jgi:hypothetical protein
MSVQENSYTQIFLVAGSKREKKKKKTKNKKYLSSLIISIKLIPRLNRPKKQMLEAK